MSDPQAADPIGEFRAAVAVEFGPPWTTDRTSDGFVARYPLRHATSEGFAASDEVHLRVVVDEAARTFSWSTRRIAAHDLDRERKGWTLGGYSASRRVSSGRYTGLRRTMTFRRTPEGLVANPDAPEDSAGREADLRAVAARLGWTERAGAGSGGLNVAVDLPPKRMLVLMAVFAAVVVLSILGIGIFVVSQVAGSLLR